MDDHGRLGQRVRDQRKALGLTQTQLAHKAQVSVPTIVKLERHGHLPGPLLLDSILAAVDLPAGVKS